MKTESLERTSVRAPHLEALCGELRDFLVSAKRAVDDEIHFYPTPIPRCDAQFNFLYEQRSRISQWLERASGPMSPGDESTAPMNALVEFSASTPITGNASELALRERIKTELARFPSNVIETRRLVLRRLEPDDSPFILELVNEPSWVKYIGDKGVHSLEDAENYIRKGPMDMYERHGFGLYLVETREGGESIGICGLIKRATLDDIDLGFALLPGYWGERYAFEAASATLTQARDVLGISRVVAITSRDNDRSIKLLEKLGFRFERHIPIAGEELNLYAIKI